MIDGVAQVRVHSVTATVGEVEAELFRVEVGGREHLAKVVKDALNGETAWFMDDGKIHLAQAPSRAHVVS